MFMLFIIFILSSIVAKHFLIETAGNVKSMGVKFFFFLLLTLSGNEWSEADSDYNVKKSKDKNTDPLAVLRQELHQKGHKGRPAKNHNKGKKV